MGHSHKCPLPIKVSDGNELKRKVSVKWDTATHPQLPLALSEGNNLKCGSSVNWDAATAALFWTESS